MADASSSPTYHHGRLNPAGALAGLLHRLQAQAQAPNSPQLMGFLTLIITGSVLIFLTGLTVTATILGLIFFTPLVIISSPIWVPIGTVVFVVAAGFLFFCGSGVAAVAGLSWMYRYFRGLQHAGSERVDYAGSRIYDTASPVKDYAGDYFRQQNRAKDAAPGA